MTEVTEIGRQKEMDQQFEVATEEVRDANGLIRTLSRLHEGDFASRLTICDLGGALVLQRWLMCGVEAAVAELSREIDHCFPEERQKDVPNSAS